MSGSTAVLQYKLSMCNLYLTGLIQLFMNEIQAHFKHFQRKLNQNSLVNAYNRYVFFSPAISMFHVKYQ